MTIKVRPFRLVPLQVPLHRRRQTFATLLWVLVLPLCMFLSAGLLYWPITRGFALVYFVWAAFDAAPERGARPRLFMRRLRLWRWMRDYFPASLVSEHELDAKRPHIFGYHPHGIIAIGAWLGFATEAAGFADLFPGIKVCLLTLGSNFRIPFFRELLMSLGVASCSWRSCDYVLSLGTGNAVALVVGGASESLRTNPGRLDLILRRRLGFINLAVRHAAVLVPVLGFGENSLYDLLPVAPGSFIDRFQARVKGIFGWTVPIFIGRGVFNYSLGLLPHRRPIVVVTGNPVDPVAILGEKEFKYVQNVLTSGSKKKLSSDHASTCSTLSCSCLLKDNERNFSTLPHCKKDSECESKCDTCRLKHGIQKIQNVYIKELESIWERHKDKYANDRLSELNILE